MFTLKHYEREAVAKSCVFFGQRWISLSEQEKTLLQNTVIELITNEGVTDFIFGGYGSFDSIAYQTVSEIKKQYPNIRRIRALTYIPKQQEDMDYLNHIYDFFYLSENAEVGLPKYAITRRNRTLAKECDFMICYVMSNSGGAYTAMKTAKANGKTVINLTQSNLGN